MKLYRKIDGRGWLEDHGDKPDDRWADLGWRPATRAERLWRLIFHERFSFADYATLSMVLALRIGGALDWIGFVFWIIVAAIAVVFLKVFTEPGREPLRKAESNG